MRITQSLLRQHIGWHFEKHWNVQRKRVPIQTGVDKILREKGFEIEDPIEFLKEKVVHERIEVVGFGNRPPKLDHTHPNWHDRKLLTYKDNNVLLEGLTQAKILTNTVQITDGLPEKIEPATFSSEFNRRIKKIILGSFALDAQQVKLPKVKDPERPAWNFPRTYGITQNRSFKLLVSKLLNLIETSSDVELVKQRFLTDNLIFSYLFEKDNDLIQFQLLGDFVLLSKEPLSPVTQQSTKEFDLPIIDPIKPTITLNEENIYVLDNIYPIKKESPFYPHTLFINFDPENVKNIFEEEVTEDQIHGRNLLKTFTAAASYARARYGETVTDLPSPVTIQSIQTDGKMFYFGVLQLNTLDLNSKDQKNIWYHVPGMPLYESCGYNVGKPVLLGYNKDVIRHLLGFYNNV
ncbi:mitochondrial ribosomal protein L37 [Rhynchophorus ferrugineus]|uniref:mitochondrial ribosomal protein L37 n=1 Tax=Rhynchophorus ferrugineus TaxID=354439 RepID=UPI003FCDC6F6